MQVDDYMDLFDFDLEGMADVERDLEEAAAKARAVKTRSRIQARRASSEALLASILPEEIAGTPEHIASCLLIQQIQSEVRANPLRGQRGAAATSPAAADPGRPRH